jgi:hypothetical protein
MSSVLMTPRAATRGQCSLRRAGLTRCNPVTGAPALQAADGVAASPAAGVGDLVAPARPRPGRDDPPGRRVTR